MRSYPNWIQTLRPFTLSIYSWRDIFRREETYEQIKRLSGYAWTNSATDGR